MIVLYFLFIIGVTACKHSGKLGDFSYCSTKCPCDIGQGDCDNNDECLRDLQCIHDKGSCFGFSPKTDICLIPNCHIGCPGDLSYCSSQCQCLNGEGNCHSNFTIFFQVEPKRPLLPKRDSPHWQREAGKHQGSRALAVLSIKVRGQGLF